MAPGPVAPAGPTGPELASPTRISYSPLTMGTGTKWMGRAALVLGLSVLCAEAADRPAPPVRLGLAVFSTGTWATYGTLDGFSPRLYDNGLKRYEFNKILALGLYGRILGVPAYLSVPWQWTSRRREEGSENRVALGDGEFYAGRRIGRTEIRAGLIFPAGYDRGRGSPWIGPGNLQATLGAAVNPNITRYSRRWELGAEAKWAYALDDAIAKSGSWGFHPNAKVSFRPSERRKTGIEFLGYWKSSYWGRSADFGQSVLGRDGPRAQWNAGLVSSVFFEEYLNRNIAVGVKGGHSLWGYRDAVSYNASAYLLYFP